jgi:hypothetical protein
MIPNKYKELVGTKQKLKGYLFSQTKEIKEWRDMADKIYDKFNKKK